MPNKKKGLQPVPVIVVGSHYDLVPVEDQQETVTRVQSLVNEMKVKYVCCISFVCVFILLFTQV